MNMHFLPNSEIIYNIFLVGKRQLQAICAFPLWGSLPREKTAIPAIIIIIFSIIAIIIIITRVASHLDRSDTPGITCIVARLSRSDTHAALTNGKAPRA